MIALIPRLQRLLFFYSFSLYRSIENIFVEKSWKVIERERERHKKWSTVWTSMPLLQQFAFSFHSQWWREVIKAIRSALFCEFIEIHFRGDQDYSRGMMRVVAFRSRDIRLWVVDEKEKEKSQILSRLIDFWMVEVGSRLLILRW